jgi:hypothetical protein
MSARPVYELRIPGEATRREYTAYLVVVQQRGTGRVVAVYVGKTGDNREGCNPVISRFGNHVSFNKLHSQLRNRFPTIEEFDFHLFYALFGDYIAPESSREGIDIINEMERQLNTRAQAAFGDLVIKPFKGSGWVSAAERERRAGFRSAERMERLDALITAAKRFVTNEASREDDPASNSSPGVRQSG